MVFPLSTILGGLALISSIIAAPTPSPDRLVVNIGGQDVTVSSPGPVTFVSGDKSAGVNSSSIPMPKAIYFISNANDANAVIALKVAANGTLSYGSSTPTGGSGMNGIDSKTKGPAAPDSLFSQGAVKVAGNMLVAVNPGDNTMTMFTISPTDATNLTRIGEPVNTQGDFPTSVTLSAKLNQACVANSGSKAGVTCFSISPTTGLTPLNTTLQPFNLGQTTPPVGATNTVSQVFFNEDSTALMTTVKGNPAVNTTGFLSIIPVYNGMVDGTKEIRTSPPGTAVLFGTANIPNNTSSLFVTDASFGSATLSLSPNNTATISAKTLIKDQSATCWATISEVTKTAFVADVAVNHLVEVDYVTGELVKEYQLGNGNSGMIDLVAAGDFVYALSPGNGTRVVVFDVSGGRGSAKEVQNFLVEGVGEAAQGMTFS